MAAARVGVEVAAHEAHLLHAAAQLGYGAGDRHARRLRELADAGETIRVQRDDAGDEVVAGARPGGADRLVAEVVAHGGGARREDGQVDAALGHEPHLAVLNGLAAKKTAAVKKATAAKTTSRRRTAKAQPAVSGTRAYRRMPEPEQVLQVYGQTGSITGVAKHLDVPGTPSPAGPAGYAPWDTPSAANNTADAARHGSSWCTP